MFEYRLNAYERWLKLRLLVRRKCRRKHPSRAGHIPVCRAFRLSKLTLDTGTDTVELPCVHAPSSQPPSKLAYVCPRSGTLSAFLLVALAAGTVRLPRPATCAKAEPSKRSGHSDLSDHGRSGPPFRHRTRHLPAAVGREGITLPKPTAADINLAEEAVQPIAAPKISKARHISTTAALSPLRCSLPASPRHFLRTSHPSCRLQLSGANLQAAQACIWQAPAAHDAVEERPKRGALALASARSQSLWPPESEAYPGTDSRF